MSADTGKTDPLVHVARARRTSEVLESLRARRGNAHAEIVGLAATTLVQLQQMHALIHRQDAGIDKEVVLCISFGVLQQSLIKLFAAASVNLDDVAILLPLIMQDMDDAVRGVVHPPHEGGA